VTQEFEVSATTRTTSALAVVARDIATRPQAHPQVTIRAGGIHMCNDLQADRADGCLPAVAQAASMFIELHTFGIKDVRAGEARSRTFDEGREAEMGTMFVFNSSVNTVISSGLRSGSEFARRNCCRPLDISRNGSRTRCTHDAEANKSLPTRMKSTSRAQASSQSLPFWKP
jgi:hypothetical protein